MLSPRVACLPSIAVASPRTPEFSVAMVQSMATTRAALARTYRPRNFAEMATQEHVSETLRAAVARGRVAHAYLFSGSRGVGKTTAARVLAMALNCPNRVTEESADG